MVMARDSVFLWYGNGSYYPFHIFVQKLQLLQRPPRGSCRERMRNTLVAAVALLVLGTTNVIIGEQKLATHQQIIQEWPAHRGGALLHDTLPLGKENERFNALQGRISFYRFVVLGGRTMLALAGIFFLASLVWAGEAVEQRELGSEIDE